MVGALLLGAQSFAQEKISDEPLIKDAVASIPLIGFRGTFNYGDGAFVAKVSFTETTVTWDDGESKETDKYKFTAFPNSQYFVQWTENDGTAVTLFIDLKNKVCHNSVFTVIEGERQAWFMKGVILEKKE